MLWCETGSVLSGQRVELRCLVYFAGFGLVVVLDARVTWLGKFIGTAKLWSWRDQRQPYALALGFSRRVPSVKRGTAFAMW